MDEDFEDRFCTRLPEIRSNTSSPIVTSAKLPRLSSGKHTPERSENVSARRRLRPKSDNSVSSRSDGLQLFCLTPLKDLKKSNWVDYPVISDELYNEKKEKLLKTSILKEDLKYYFDIDKKKGIIKTEDSGDEAYDTDLDTNKVSVELIVDEKTKQIKDDGIFSEYKKTCRDLKIIPNSYLIRHAIEDDFTMRHRYMSFSDCIAISKEVENNLTFSTVDLQDNGITHRHLQAMVNMFTKNSYLTDVNLSYNPLGPNGPRIIKIILQNNAHISKADFSGCNMGDDAGVYFAETIENNVYLRELYLRQNKIGNNTAVCIGNALGSNITLEVLDLSWNNINRPGAIALAAGLRQNSQLQVFNIAMNGFGEEGGIALFEALRNQDSLTELDISANRLTDKVARVISTIIPYNRHLRTLKISYNLISAVGALTLLKPYSSRMKKRLTTVELQGIDIDAELVDAVNTLQTKRGMTVLISRPPSRRERTCDQLTYSLVSIVELMKEYDFDVYDLFPEYEDEKEDLITTDDIMSAFKKSEKEVERRKLQTLKRTIRETRDRKFQLKEFAVLYTQVNRGSDPTIEEPLRTFFAGRKRASTPLSVKRKRQETQSRGVRFL